jgi:hypothetical protein
MIDSGLVYRVWVSDLSISFVEPKKPDEPDPHHRREKEEAGPPPWLHPGTSSPPPPPNSSAKHSHCLLGHSACALPGSTHFWLPTLAEEPPSRRCGESHNAAEALPKRERERGTVVVLLKVARAGNDSPVSTLRDRIHLFMVHCRRLRSQRMGHEKRASYLTASIGLEGCAARASPVHAFKRPVNLRRLRANHA